MIKVGLIWKGEVLNISLIETGSKAENIFPKSYMFYLRNRTISGALQMIPMLHII